MPRKQIQQRGVPNDAHSKAERARIDWFSADASVESIADWDLNTELLAAVQLAFLSRGYAVLLGVTRGGTAVSFAVRQGDELWQRKYVSDGFELNELLQELWKKLNPQHIDIAAD